MRLRLTVFLDGSAQAGPVKELVQNQGFVPIGDNDFPVLDVMPVEVDQKDLELILAAVASKAITTQ